MGGLVIAGVELTETTLLVPALVGMATVLTVVIRSLMQSMQKRDEANVSFQREVLQQLQQDRREDRVVLERIVVAQEGIIDRLESLEAHITREAS